MMKSFPRARLLAVALAVPFASWGCEGNGFQNKPPSAGEAEARPAASDGGLAERGPVRGPAQPGQILPPFARERLELTSEQKKQVDELQQEADRKLGDILSEQQKQQLKEMQEG